MKDYRYSLEKGNKKHLCPRCHKKRYVRYMDNENGHYIPYEYGRCDRETNCRYHFNPYTSGYAYEIQKEEQRDYRKKKTSAPAQSKIPKQEPISQIPEPVYFDFETFKQTLNQVHYQANNFIQNLFYNVPFPFEVPEVTRVVQLYRLGTNTIGNLTGAITFPFIDIEQRVRAIQIKQFDNNNHTKQTSFLHAELIKHYTQIKQPIPDWLQAYNRQERKVTCFFGEHLLSKYPHNPIALVEAPKTAIYGTLYFGLPDTPDSLIWLAVYNKSSIPFEKFKVLQNRFVLVFPDLSENGLTFQEWATKFNSYQNDLPGTKFVFSELLERSAPEADKIKGKDLADYIIQLNWREFRRSPAQAAQAAPLELPICINPLSHPYLPDTNKKCKPMPGRSRRKRHA